jgi:hypothetical protein
MDEVTKYQHCLLRQQLGEGNGPWGNQVFVGRRNQRGFGRIKNFFSKFVLPTAKLVGRIAIKQALEGGKEILSGKDPRTVLKEKGKQIFKSSLAEALKSPSQNNSSTQETPTQSGSGRKRHRAIKRQYFLDLEDGSSLKRKRRRKSG